MALPSCGENGDTLGDLYDDVQVCHEAIAEVDGPIVLCGHSYGGMIITEAGADGRVSKLLYVTSVMPDAGQSQADLIGSEPAPWLQPSEDGTIGVDPDMIREFFLQLLPARAAGPRGLMKIGDASGVARDADLFLVPVSPISLACGSPRSSGLLP